MSVCQLYMAGLMTAAMIVFELVVTCNRSAQARERALATNDVYCLPTTRRRN